MALTKSPMQHLQKAVDIAGTGAELARRVRVSPQAVSQWFRRRKVPAEHCPSIEEATLGAVRCEELAPDVRWHVLRGSESRRF